MPNFLTNLRLPVTKNWRALLFVYFLLNKECILYAHTHTPPWNSVTSNFAVEAANSKFIWCLHNIGIKWNSVRKVISNFTVQGGRWNLRCITVLFASHFSESQGQIKILEGDQVLLFILLRTTEYLNTSVQLPAIHTHWWQSIPRHSPWQLINYRSYHTVSCTDNYKHHTSKMQCGNDLCTHSLHQKKKLNCYALKHYKESYIPPFF